MFVVLLEEVLYAELSQLQHQGVGRGRLLGQQEGGRLDLDRHLVAEAALLKFRHLLGKQKII